MSDLYLDRYGIASARLAAWDYGAAALYFVTICTADRVHFFGRVRAAQMRLSELGRIAAAEWFKTAALRPDMNVALDAFCVMPNHVHMVIGIGANAFNASNRDDDAMDADRDVPDRNDGMDAAHGRDAMHRVSTTASRDGRASSARPAALRDGRASSARPTNQFGPQRKNLASIVRGYKSAVTTQARVLDLPFSWQPRFYDVIIPDAAALDRIRRYIDNNPRNWRVDRFG